MILNTFSNADAFFYIFILLEARKGRVLFNIMQIFQFQTTDLEVLYSFEVSNDVEVSCNILGF